MTDKNGEKITLMDKVVLDHGAVGVVSEFDRINGRGFAGVRCIDSMGQSVKLWATENAITKI